MTNSPAGDQHPPSGATPPRDGMASFFNWFRSTGLQRSDSRWIGGVAGGIAARLGIDPIIVRGALIVIAVLGGPVLFLYAAAWALIPDSAGRIYLERAIHGIFDPAIIAIGVLAVVTFVPFMRGLWWEGAPSWWHMPGWLESTLTTGWVIALIVLAVWIVVMFTRRDQNDGAASPPAGAPPQQPNAPQHDFWTSTAQGAPGWSSGDQAPSGAWTPAAPTSGGPNPTPAAPFFASAAAAPTSPAADAGTTPSAADGAAPLPRHHGDRTPGWTSQEFREELDRQRSEQARENRERAAQRRHTVPGAGFIAIALGLALVGGALAAVFISQAGRPDAALVVGIGAALAVIAIATVVAGVAGRQSGWLASFAWVGVIAMLVVGVVPAGTQVRTFGTSDWQVTSSEEGGSQGFAMIAGAPSVDLSKLDRSGATHNGTINVWVGAGKLDIVLPDNVPVIVKLSTLAGTMSVENQNRGDQRGGVFYSNEARFGRTSSPDTVTVQVWMLAGSTHIIDNNDRAAR